MEVYIKEEMYDSTGLIWNKPYQQGHFTILTISMFDFTFPDRQFLFVTEKHIYELGTWEKVCSPIPKFDGSDFQKSIREYVRD